MNATVEKILGAARKIHWPAAVAIALIVLGAYILPDSRLEKIEDLLTRDWSSVSALIVALVGLVGLVQTKGLVKSDTTTSSSSTTTTVSTRTTEDPPSKEAGFSHLSPMVIVTALFLFVSGCALLLPGCGAGSLRLHANAADAAWEILSTADAMIVDGTRESIARCPEDDGAERVACLNAVEHDAEIAAASRDVLMTPANVYKHGVLEIDPASPTLDSALGALAAPVIEGWPSFVAAMGALGRAINPVPFVGVR